MEYLDSVGLTGFADQRAGSLPYGEQRRLGDRQGHGYGAQADSPGRARGPG